MTRDTTYTHINVPRLNNVENLTMLIFN